MTPITDQEIIAGYLSDASNLRGNAEFLFRPRDTAEVAAVVTWCQERGVPITVSASRTSTTGAPVPMGGAILSTENLREIRGLDDVDGGVLLGEYQAHTERSGRMFPPDPTSRHECSVGGAIACNASGAGTFKYGPTRKWIESVEVVLPDGKIVTADRGVASPWRVPQWTEPAVKTAAGYFPATNLLDLIIGSEGTLGIVTRARTRLVAVPTGVLTIFTYFATRSQMLAFLATARGMGPRCLEYFDRHSLALIRGRVDDVPEADSALLIEVEHEGEAPLDEWFEALVDAGALVDSTLVVTDAVGRQKLHAIRHALPATTNEIIARNGVQKVGTDFAVPDDRLAEMMALYDAVDLPTVCFGHIGNSHLHLNLLPANLAELDRAREIYGELARAAVVMGGTVSAEHGIGRLKRTHLAMMVPPAVLSGWRALRAAADPNGIFGRGVML